MKFIPKIICIMTLAPLALIGEASIAQTSASDTTFAKNAAAGGMAEVKLGELAQQKGANSTVKDFGKRMETDHSKAGDKLKSVASKDSIELPGEMNKKDQAAYNRLAKLSGPEFDRAYAQNMVADHEKDIADFKTEARSGQNGDVRNFADNTLPTLEEHLKLAKEMEKSVNSSQSSRAGY